MVSNQRIAFSRGEDVDSEFLDSYSNSMSLGYGVYLRAW